METNHQALHVDYHELEQAIYDLSSRGMHQAARWVAELLCGLDRSLLEQATITAECGGSQPLRTDPTDRTPQYMLARQHFEFKEYKRAAHVLRGLTGPKALFLRCWCLYLAGEKRKEELRDELAGGKAGSLGDGGGVASAGGRQAAGGVLLLSGASPNSGPANQELDGIEADLTAAVQSGQADAFCAYLLGLVLLDRGHKEEAMDVLLLSLRSCPSNWAAWLALQRLVLDKRSWEVLPKDAAAMPPQTHWGYNFFRAATCVEMQENAEALSILQHMVEFFPVSSALVGMVAQAQYNTQNFEPAQLMYEDLLSRDPYRLEGMDTYSNILFVKEQPAQLSMLAHSTMSIDKYRSETCCVVGNYYSLKGSHEMAVSWFRRALRLQRSCLAAWTLMGHEYMELKNTGAAVEAYRAAVELNPSDYRAWYGLGQAHELLKLPYYALYYFRRATTLRPRDARMWCALGQCYASAQVCNQDMAVRCYEKAVDLDDPEGVAMHLLAKLRESRGELDQAEIWFKLNLDRLDRQNGLSGAGPGGGGAGAMLSSDAVEALLFMANQCKATGRLADAKAYCERLLDVGGPPRDHAKALAREIHALQALHKAGAGGTPVPRTRAGGSAAAAAAAAGHGAVLRATTGAGGHVHTSAAPHTASHTPAGMHALAMFDQATAAGAAGRGRNLFSALGHVGHGGTETGHVGAGGGVRPGSGLLPMTPLPAPLFGASPAPPLFHQGTPMSIAAPTPATGIPTYYQHHHQQTVTPSHMAMSNGSTPTTDGTRHMPATESTTGRPTESHFTHGSHVPYCAREDVSQGSDFTPSDAAASPLPRASRPAWLVTGSAQPGAEEGDQEGTGMDMATPASTSSLDFLLINSAYQDGMHFPSQWCPSHSQGVDTATPGEGGGVTAAGAQQPAGQAGVDGEALAAVAQQLRVSEDHAAALLASVGGDPVAAIRHNLHLLGPAVED